MTLHSPGPWTVNYDPEESASIWIESPAGPIAKIEPCDRDDGNGEVLSSRDFADARIMAASLELLVAAKELLLQVDRRCGGRAAGNSDLVRAADDMRAAITKAADGCDG